MCGRYFSHAGKGGAHLTRRCLRAWRRWAKAKIHRLRKGGLDEDAITQWSDIRFAHFVCYFSVLWVYAMEGFGVHASAELET